MAADGFSLLHSAPSQGEGGATVGLWLFFAGVEKSEQEEPEETPSFWWHEIREKKGLGLSLTLTGIAAVIMGFVLHLALQNNIIDATLHLGYLFGIVGLLLFLIG